MFTLCLGGICDGGGVGGGGTGVRSSVSCGLIVELKYLFCCLAAFAALAP